MDSDAKSLLLIVGLILTAYACGTRNRSTEEPPYTISRLNRIAARGPALEALAIQAPGEHCAFLRRYDDAIAAVANVEDEDRTKMEAAVARGATVGQALTETQQSTTDAYTQYGAAVSQIDRDLARRMHDYFYADPPIVDGVQLVGVKPPKRRELVDALAESPGDPMLDYKDIARPPAGCTP
jgi:hypothetical protein